jgi:sialic acid synthase SpsE
MINPFGPDCAHTIAEIGVNHEGSLSRAELMIQEAAAAGFSSVKLQYYTARTLASRYASAYWDETEEPEGNQQNLFSKFPTLTPDEVGRLSRLAHTLELDFGLSVFDVDLLSDVHGYCDYLKVASGDITHLPLIEAMAETKLPIIVSTGASTEDEVIRVYDLLAGRVEMLAFLQCTLSYPTKLADANISSLSKLQQICPGALTGISDHISDTDPLRFIVARTLGASVFEKHFTLTPDAPGNDHYHAFEPRASRKMVQAIQATEELLELRTFMLPCEEAARTGARRSAFYTRDLKAGEPVNADDVQFLRPGNWTSPWEASRMLPGRLTKSVAAEDPVVETDFQATT